MRISDLSSDVCSSDLKSFGCDLLPGTIAEDHDNTRAEDKTRGTAIDFNGKAGLWRLLPWSRDWLSPCPRLGTGDGHRRGLHRRCLNAGNVRLTLQPGNEPRAFRQCRAALIPSAHIGRDFRRIITGCAMQVIEKPDRRARGHTPAKSGRAQ